MKINTNPMASFNREVPAIKPTSRAASVEMPATPTETPKAAPPGLERVLAKFEAMGEGARTAGQSNAMSRIERNLARYIETQAMGSTPVEGATEAPVEAVEEALSPPVETAPGTGTAPEVAADAPLVPEEPAAVVEEPVADAPDPMQQVVQDLADPGSEVSLLDALLAPTDQTEPSNPA